MSNVTQFTQGIVDPVIATILSGQTTSDSVDTLGTTFTQLEMPAAFDGTALTFETSSDDSKFGQYQNIDGVPVSIDPVAPNIHYGLAAQDFFPVRYLKIVSNTTETADREIRLIPKAI